MRCGLRRRDIAAWIRDYDNIQRLAVKLIYIQIGCALIGSLGPLYNGILLLNLGISLFGLVAIACSSQPLSRTYIFLLFASIFVDISWFLLFSRDIWLFPSDFPGTFVIYLVKLVLAVQIVGFSVRLSSSLLWMQMNRLGLSYPDHSASTETTDADIITHFLTPDIPIPQSHAGAEDPLYRPYLAGPRRVSEIQEISSSSSDSFGGVLPTKSPTGQPFFL